MLVEMLKSAAGPNGSYLVGERVTLDDVTAKEFIAAEAARPYTDPPVAVDGDDDKSPTGKGEPRTADAPTPAKPKSPPKQRTGARGAVKATGSALKKATAKKAEKRKTDGTTTVARKG